MTAPYQVLRRSKVTLTNIRMLREDTARAGLYSRTVSWPVRRYVALGRHPIH
jgi:hypothetical protein